jgi:hypothetical protein
MRKFFAFTLLVAAFGALWMGFAQTASAGEPHGDDVVVNRHEACTADETLVNAQCVRVDLGVDEVVGDVADTVDNLVDELL